VIRALDRHGRAGARRIASARAFTIVEMLTVVSILVILSVILLVALSGAIKSSGRSAVVQQLSRIGQGVEQFKSDLGYYPPLITTGESDGAIVTPELNPSEFNNANNVPNAYKNARYMSEFTLAAYLLGMGDFNGDDQETYDNPSTQAIERNDDDGVDGPGFRNPGPTRAWKAAANPAEHQPSGEGRVYGPYMETAGMDDFVQRDDSTGLYRFVDRWGNPIRYYLNIPARDANGAPSVALIPSELRSPESMESQITACAGGTHDLTLDRDLLNAPFVLLSAGDEARDRDALGNPIVPFGDVVTDDLNNRVELPCGPGTPFDPCALTASQQAQLTGYLKTNVRHIP